MDHPHLLDLPFEILHIINSYLEYASEVNSLAQTCRYLSHSANASLYPYWAKKCSPAGIRRIVANDNVDALRKLLSCGLTHQEYPDRGTEGWSPLYLACEKGCTNVVRALLENFGSQIIPAINDHLTWFYRDVDPVYAAASNGHLEALKLLVEAGIPAETKRSALMRVIKKNPSPSLPIIRYMVTEAGFEMDHKNRHIAGTPLGAAANHGKWDVFKLLVELGACSNPVTELRTGFNRYAPIVCAAKGNNTEMLKFLLDGPARLALAGTPDADDAADLAISGRDAIDTIVLEQIEQVGPSEEDPFVRPSDELVDELYQYAAASGDQALADRMLATEWKLEVAADQSPFDNAAQFGHTQIIKTFLDSIKTNRELFEDVNWFPLLIEPAIANNHESTLRLVLDYGGKAMISTCAATALDCAIRQGRKSFTTLLIEHGALDAIEQRDTMEDFDLSNILEAAYLKGDYSLIEYLLKRNDLGVFDDLTEKFDEWSPAGVSNAVEAAAYYGPLEGFKKTLELGAVTLDPEDHRCHDVFCYAIDGVQREIIQYFLDNGYELKRGTSDEPLLASVFDSDFFDERTTDEVLTTIRLLLDAGAELEAKDSDDCTPLAIVVRDSSKGYSNKETCSRIIQELLARGADPLTGLEAGKSALQIAMNHHDLELLQTLLGMVEAQGYVLGLHPYKGEMGDTPISTDRWNLHYTEENKWDDFFVTRALRQHYWRMVYPVRKKGEEADTVPAIVFPRY